jgi:hypothetical protein
MWIKTVLVTMLLSVVAFSQAEPNEKVKKFAHAIALTEGCYVRGSIPNRYHNCGDLKIMERGQHYDGEVGVGKANHVRFRNDAAGYAALYHQIDKMLTGESKFYRQEMTLQQVGKLYAQNSRRWSTNLAKYLGVPPSTTLEEYFGLPPRVTMEIPREVPQL